MTGQKRGVEKRVKDEGSLYKSTLKNLNIEQKKNQILQKSIVELNEEKQLLFKDKSMIENKLKDLSDLNKTAQDNLIESQKKLDILQEEVAKSNEQMHTLNEEFSELSAKNSEIQKKLEATEFQLEQTKLEMQKVQELMRLYKLHDESFQTSFRKMNEQSNSRLKILQTYCVLYDLYDIFEGRSQERYNIDMIFKENIGYNALLGKAERIELSRYSEEHKEIIRICKDANITQDKIKFFFKNYFIDLQAEV